MARDDPLPDESKLQQGEIGGWEWGERPLNGEFGTDNSLLLLLPHSLVLLLDGGEVSKSGVEILGRGAADDDGSRAGAAIDVVEAEEDEKRERNS
jgi:hypothetical protein